MSKRQYDCVIPGIAGAIAEINQRFNAAIDAAAKPKPVSYGDIEMTVTRDQVEVPVQVLITSKGATEAWVCEDKGKFKNGESVVLTLEEIQEAEARYHRDENEDSRGEE